MIIAMLIIKALSSVLLVCSLGRCAVSDFPRVDSMTLSASSRVLVPPPRSAAPVCAHYCVTTAGGLLRTSGVLAPSKGDGDFRCGRITSAWAREPRKRSADHGAGVGKKKGVPTSWYEDSVLLLPNWLRSNTAIIISPQKCTCSDCWLWLLITPLASYNSITTTLTLKQPSVIQQFTDLLATQNGDFLSSCKRCASSSRPAIPSRDDVYSLQQEDEPSEISQLNPGSDVTETVLRLSQGRRAGNREGARNPLLLPALALAFVLALLQRRCAIFLGLIVLLLAGRASASVIRFYGGLADEQSYAMSLTSDGGAYLTGYTKSYGNGGADVWTIKVQSDGTALWSVTSGTSDDEWGYGIDVTASGGCIVVGTYLSSSAHYAYIVLYDSSGNLLGQSTLADMTDAYGVKTLTVGSGYAIVGVRYTALGSSYAYIAVLAPSLTKTWATQATAMGAFMGVTEAADGKLAASGWQWGRGFYAYGTYYSNGTQVSLFTVAYGCCRDFMVNHIQLSDGNILLVGSTNSVVNGGPYYIWLEKTNFAGNSHIWRKSYGSSAGNYYPTAATELADGSIMVVGNTTVNTAGGADIYLLHVSSTGATISEDTIGFSGDDGGSSIRYRDSDHTIAFGGYSYQSMAQQQYYLNISVFCVAGQYMDTATSVCLSCPAGSVQAGYNKTWCDACGIGTYQNLAGQAYCINCIAGTYQGATGQTTCIPCWIGSAQPLAGQATCDNCVVGTNQSAIAEASCFDCVAGTYQDKVGQADCIACSPGYVQPLTRQITCDACDVGTHQTFSGMSYCDDCVAGTYQNAAGQAECIPCLAGSVQPLTKQTGCNLCDVGTHQAAAGQVACADCDPGSFVNYAGAVLCDLCVPGTYQNLAKQTACVQCGLMMYQDLSGMPGCKSCPPTKYQDEMGQSYCKSCLTNCSLCTIAIDCSACIVDNFMLTIGSTIYCELPCRDQYYGDTGDYTCKRT